MNRTIPSCVLFMAAGGILSAQSIAFDSAPAYMAPSSAFAVGDFNKDAKPDIASGVYTIVLLNGRGDGNFWGTDPDFAAEWRRPRRFDGRR